MWSVILAVLQAAIVPLTIAQSLLKNFDANNEGIDDKIADGLAQGIELILGAVATDVGIPGQAKGLVAITAYGRMVTTRLTAIKGTSPMTGELKTEAQGLLDSLSDPNKVYQAKRSKDAEALKAAKIEATSLNSQIQGA